MATLPHPLAAFFRRPLLLGRERRTYPLHLAYALLTAAADGLMANAPTIALKAMGAGAWALNARLFFSGLGMISTLYLGAWMAHRPKMPFVRVPGLLFAACSALMALATSHAYLFLLLWGLGSVFEMITRPPITAILRFNYHPARRGHAIGETRKWASLAYLATALAAALALDSLASSPLLIASLMASAAALYLASFSLFSRIRVHEHPSLCGAGVSPASPPLPDTRETPAPQCPHISAHEPPHDPSVQSKIDNRKSKIPGLFSVLARDRRFRWYLLAAFLFGFSGLLYSEQTRTLFAGLGFSYLAIFAFSEAVPLLAQFLTTGFWGRHFDRTAPNRAWVPIRIGWGLDPLLLILAALAWPLAGPWPTLAIVLFLLARLCRGAVMGGSWVLWWRVGIAHFAPPGPDTSLYMGILTFLNGLMRLAAALVSSWLLFASAASPSSPSLPSPVPLFSRSPALAGVGGIFLLGGLGVLLSALLSALLARSDRKHSLPPTIADFEAARRQRNP